MEFYLCLLNVDLSYLYKYFRPVVLEHFPQTNLPERLKEPQ